MKTKWFDDFGGVYDTEEEARDSAWDTMEDQDFVHGMEKRVSYESLLMWANAQPNFFEHFEDIISEIEMDFFNENYHEEEVEDNDGEDE